MCVRVKRIIKGSGTADGLLGVLQGLQTETVFGGEGNLSGGGQELVGDWGC